MRDGVGLGGIISDVVRIKQAARRQCMKAVRECSSGLGQEDTADTTTSAETSGGTTVLRKPLIAVWLTVMSGLSCIVEEHLKKNPVCIIGIVALQHSRNIVVTINTTLPKRMSGPIYIFIDV